MYVEILWISSLKKQQKYLCTGYDDNNESIDKFNNF